MPPRMSGKISVSCRRIFPSQNLKAGEFLRVLGRGLGAKTNQVDRLLELVGLKSIAVNTSKPFPGGMIQRLGLAVCLLKDPRVLILDEPALGLDILGQRQVLELIGGLNQQGKTIFLPPIFFPRLSRPAPGSGSSIRADKVLGAGEGIDR